MTDYRTYLEAIGRKPIPSHSELRAPHTPGAVELPATARPWWPGNVRPLRFGLRARVGGAK